MKRNLIRLMLGVAVAWVAQVALESQADAGLLRRGGRNHGCRQAASCEPAPADNDCGCNNGGRRHTRRHRRGNCCCENGAEAAPTNGEAAPAAPDAPDGGEMLPL